MPQRLRPWLAAVALTAAGAAGARASNGPAPPSVGFKGPVSFPAEGDAHSAFRMPSGIGWALDHQVQLDLFVFVGEATMNNRLNAFQRSDTTLGATFGVIFAPGRPDPDDPDDAAEIAATSDEDWFSYGMDPRHKVTFGVGTFIDMAAGGKRSRVRYQTYPETVGLRQDILFLTTAFTVAYTPTRWLSLGLAGHVTYATLDVATLVGGGETPLEGSPQINGVPLPGSPTYADFLDLFDNDADEDPTSYFEAELSAFQFSGAIALSLRPLPNLAFGLSYRPRAWAPEPFEGDGVVDASRTLETALGGLSPSVRDLFLATLPDGGQNGFRAEYDVELEGPRVPRQVRGSLVFWPVPELVFGLEVAWIEWHRAFKKTRVVLANGSNTDLNFISGSSRIDTALDQGWDNQWVFAGYVAWAATDWLTLRAGFNHADDPFDADAQNNLPSKGYTDTHVSLGVGLQLGGFEVGVLVEHAFYASETSGPTEAASVTARETRYGSRQWFVHLGLGYSF